MTAIRRRRLPPSSNYPARIKGGSRPIDPIFRAPRLSFTYPSRKFGHLRLGHDAFLIVERERRLGRVRRKNRETKRRQQAASGEEHERGEDGVDRRLWRDQIVGAGDKSK